MAEAIEALPSHKRKTLRQIAGALGVSLWVVQQYLRGDSSFIVAHTNSIKPYLTDADKYAQVCFAIDRMVKKPNGQLLFSDCYDMIHVDEKWFFLTEANMRYYMTTSEKEATGDEQGAPKQQCAHKSHILKVMFFAAVARPRFEVNEQGDECNCTFDGKIGIWPFVERVAAKRSSNRRTKGTVETKPVNVKKENYLQMMVDKVFRTAPGCAIDRHTSNTTTLLSTSMTPIQTGLQLANWMDGLLV
jgi:hypothetical protein